MKEISVAPGAAVINYSVPMSGDGRIPFSRQMGDLGATDDRADTDYYEFVEDAMRRAREGR